MFKKLLLTIPIIMLMSLQGIAFAEIDESDVNFFLNKIATTEDESIRESGVWLLSTFLDTDSPDIRGLKLFIENTASPEDIDKLEDEGYELDEAIDSLDILGEMSRNDIQSLIIAIADQELDEMKEIMESYYEEIPVEVPAEVPVIPGGGQAGGTPGVSVTPFEDLKEVKFDDTNYHWAKDNIKFLAARGIISGYSDTKFEPNKSISRAEFTTLIVKLLDFQMLEGTELLFGDIKSNDWFYTYIKIAKDHGIINGLRDDQFGPQNLITREQMVHIVMNALEKAGKNSELNLATDSQIIDKYEDKDHISDWVKENFAKALNLGIIKGRSETQLAPKANLTRAEAATIIRSVYDLINK